MFRIGDQAYLVSYLPAESDTGMFGHWRDHLLFHEYFHGDTGAGFGASQQTDWPGLVAKMIDLFGLLDPKEYLEATSASLMLVLKSPEEERSPCSLKVLTTSLNSA